MLKVTDIDIAVPSPEAAARRLRLAVEAGRMAVWEADFRADVMHVSPDLLRLYGFAEGVMPGSEAIRAGYLPGERERLRAEMLAAVSGGRTFLVTEFRYRLPEGDERWFELRAELDPSAETALGVIMDVTDRKASEQRQRLLAAELAHRVKNTLAIVQAVASQTFRDGAEIGLAREVFSGRIAAMASAYDILLGSDWENAELGALVARTLQHQWDPERITASGPRTMLSPSVALGMSLALHELATNALKYGSLSVPAGRVSISWSYADGGTIVLEWKETGGPRILSPAARGFGTRLIERVLAMDGEGGAEIAFDPNGLRCVLRGKIVSHSQI